MKRLTLILLIAALFSCGGHHEIRVSQIPTLNPEHIKIEKEIFMSELASDGELVELETVRDSYLKWVTGYFVGKDFILIADNTIPRVFLYNRQGKFIRNIGSFGKGPGEFSRSVQICVNEDQRLIYLYSFNLFRISVYSLEGTWIKDFNTKDLCDYPTIDAMEIVGESLVLVLRRPPVKLEGFYQVWFFDKNLEFLDKQKPIPANEMAGYDMQEVILSNHFGKGLMYFDFYGDTVFCINENRTIEPVLHMDYGRMPTEMAQRQGVTELRKEFTRVGAFTSVPPYLLFVIFTKSTDPYTISVNLNSKEMGILKYSDCPTQLNGLGIVNDITGISPYLGGKYFSGGFTARIIQRWIVDGYVKKECIEAMSKTYPDQMKRYQEVFTLEKLDQNPVIEIMQLQGH